MVIAYVDDRPVGQAFGYALPPNARWWQGLSTPVPEGFTEETGTRTFALNELMVVPEWQGRGVAHALHDELLGSRKEQRATLLVREATRPPKPPTRDGLAEDREVAALPGCAPFRRDDLAAVA
jgi:GNAT superfamily N-acetyltransferase